MGALHIYCVLGQIQTCHPIRVKKKKKPCAMLL